jgi:hypothetical protein
VAARTTRIATRSTNGIISRFRVSARTIPTPAPPANRLVTRTIAAVGSHGCEGPQARTARCAADTARPSAALPPSQIAGTSQSWRGVMRPLATSCQSHPPTAAAASRQPDVTRIGSRSSQLGPASSPGGALSRGESNQRSMDSLLIPAPKVTRVTGRGAPAGAPPSASRRRASSATVAPWEWARTTRGPRHSGPHVRSIHPSVPETSLQTAAAVTGLSRNTMLSPAVAARARWMRPTAARTASMGTRPTSRKRARARTTNGARSRAARSWPATRRRAARRRGPRATPSSRR